MQEFPCSSVDGVPISLRSIRSSPTTWCRLSRQQLYLRCRRCRSPIGGAPRRRSEVVGLFSARSTTGEWKIYAGTPTKLYNWTLFAGWTELGSGHHVPEGRTAGRSAVGVGDRGADRRQASQGRRRRRRHLCRHPTAPIAHNCRTIGDFVFLGGLASNRRKISGAPSMMSTAGPPAST